MPRSPSFEPRPVKRNGQHTGKWRIYIPDPTKKVGKRGGAGFVEKLFTDLGMAEAYGNELRAAHHAQMAGLAVANPRDSIRFQELEHRAARLGFDSPEALIDSIEAKHELNPAGPSVRDILDAYQTHKAKDWTENTVSTFNTCTRPFVKVAALKAAAITPRTWEEFFNTLRQEDTMATSTYNRCIMYLQAAYEHAIHIQLLSVNPTRNISKARADLHRDPVIIKAAQIATFFDHAVRHHPETVPYWAICFFAGARPDSEAFRVTWEGILWDRDNAAGNTGEITIPKPSDRRASATKTKRTRYVELEDCLRAWLEPFRQDSGFLAPVSDRSTNPSKAIVKNSRVAISRGAYVEHEPGSAPNPVIVWGNENRDLTRHTYATAFAKAHHGETGVNSRLKNNLGHGTESTGDTYYKNPHMSNEEARSIFAIVPTRDQLRMIRAHMERD